jgi:signal transduction histidine kinase
VLREAGSIELQLKVDELSPDQPDGDRPPEPNPWMEVSAYPVRVGKGTGSGEVGTIVVMRDVTAARDARAVRDAFIGILSHELRTPVTTIYGGSEVLARSGNTLAESVRREVYDDIRAESDRLYRLVENLLVLSRVEREGLAIEREPILLQRLLPRVVSAEAMRWPAAKFELDIRPGLPPVAAEETYVEQVVRNLLTNAAKYGGGTIFVRAEPASEGRVRVSVCDDGPGFSPGEEQRLFEIFYRSPAATRRASGAGIGLFVTQQLVRAMGGQIWAANRAEGGSEFIFELPGFADL